MVASLDEGVGCALHRAIKDSFSYAIVSVDVLGAAGVPCSQRFVVFVIDIT